MIYKLKQNKNSFVEEVYKKSMKELGDFYGINWIKNKPKIFLVDDRKTINSIKQEKTATWVVGWCSDFSSIYLLDKKNFNKESSHKYTKDYYRRLIKHELAHLFFSILSSRQRIPIWLNEGMSIYLSDQLKTKKRPKKFMNFLDFYIKGNVGVYEESGFVVEKLINQFGKNKILRLIKGLSNIKSKKEFNKLFKKIYNKDLNYKLLNNL